MAATTVLLSDVEIAAIGEAVRWAPSIHNTQPWLLRRLPDGVEVLEDLSRSLPVIDPSGRDRAISCGAAILNARVALHAAGRQAAVDLLPHGHDPRAVATVRALGPRTRAVPVEDVALEPMILRRRTHRRIYRSNLVAEDDLLELRRAVAGQGARLSIVEPAMRRRLAGLLADAVGAQDADPDLRVEVERWVRRTRPGAEPAVDGIPESSLGTSPYPVDSLVHGAHPGPPQREDLEEDLARSTVLVLATQADTRHHWVVAGMALERMLLTGTSLGLVATFADQAIQVPHTRRELAELLGIWGVPQVVLRVGRPLVEAPVTPRRPLADLFVPSQDFWVP